MLITLNKLKIPEYNAWRNLRQRCNNKKSWLYKYYGGRGIKVCKRWNKYENFIKDMGQKPQPKYELDRINVNKDYKPSNCRWVDKKTQQRNQRRTVIITYKGITRKRLEWGELLGINPDTIRRRLDRGHTVKRALSKFNHRHPNETVTL